MARKGKKKGGTGREVGREGVREGRNREERLEEGEQSERRGKFRFLSQPFQQWFVDVVTMNMQEPKLHSTRRKRTYGHT